jgi:hypothetical protein
MIKLPPLPLHPDPHTYQWSEIERITMRVLQIAAARAALEAAAQVCDAIAINADTEERREYLTPHGAAVYGGMYGGAINCAGGVRALKIEGETT